jgi:DNA polymerase III subunit alpha
MLVADLHRHDDYSLFDGFGKPLENARLAKEYGYEALGTTNHGTISGIIDHWLACKEVGIKPILGIEAYFMPEFKQVKKRYHLCLFIKNLKGYQNLNKMITEANANSYYYRPIITFELLKKQRW